MRNVRKTVGTALIAANALMVAVLVADALTPLGTGVSALYGVPPHC